MWKSHICSVAVACIAALASVQPASANEVIRLGGTANYGPVLPVQAAHALKLFDKVGVNTSFTPFAGGSAGMEAMAAGEVDIILYFPPGLALAKRQGVNATVIGAGSLTPRGWAVMVKKDSPLKTLQDLVGKKLGVTATGSTTDFFALWAANEAGGQVTRIPVGGPGLLPNLLSGNVDAIVAYPPLTYKVLQADSARSLVDFGQAMSTNVPDVWIASNTIIEKNPEGVRKTLAALYSAVVYMQSHPEWTIEFIAKQTGLERDIAKQEYENTIKGLSADGVIEEAWIEESLRLAKLAGMSDIPVASDILTTKFVPVEIVEPDTK